jgi:hypothetical protein
MVPDRDDVDFTADATKREAEARTSTEFLQGGDRYRRRLHLWLRPDGRRIPMVIGPMSWKVFDRCPANSGGHDQILAKLGDAASEKTRFRSQVLKAVTAGEIAHLSTDFEGTAVDHSGETSPIHSRAIEVLRRQRDGTWKLIIGNPNGRA